MKLIIDIGNTRSKVAVFDGQRPVEILICDEVTLPLLTKTAQKYPQLQAAIVSAVKDYPEETDRFLSENFFFVKLDSHTPLPVKNQYKTPHSLGKDRIALAVAAYRFFPGENVLVIDAGTTITYDVVTEKGEYLGGAISPGIRMRLKALHEFTGKLPRVEWTDDVPDWIGNDTHSAMLSGVLNGVLAEAEGFIAACKERFPNLKIVLCGGDEKYFDKRLKNNIFALPNFVLSGLNEILDFNKKNSED